MSSRGQIWDLLEGKTLCDGFDPEYEEYTSRAHLGQLIALLGSPPKELLDRAELTSRWFESNGMFYLQITRGPTANICC